MAKDTVDKHIVKIKVDDHVEREIRVWVVWADGVTVSNAEENGPTVTLAPDHTSIRVVAGDIFTIKPPAIISDPDRPDLSGTNTAAAPNVPAADEDVYAKGDDLSQGAVGKWDSSRAIRNKVLNNSTVPVNDPAYRLPNGQSYLISKLNYPSDALVGNDDPDQQGDYPDPYTKDENGGEGPEKGKIAEFDAPVLSLFNAHGKVGETVEMRVHFRGFARLEIGGAWCAISDPTYWRVHYKFKKVAENGTDLNGDGNLNGEVWINDSSSFAKDNQGW